MNNMENSLRTGRYDLLLHQPVCDLLNSYVYGSLVRQFSMSKDKKQVQLYTFRYRLVQGGFRHTPCFAHETHYSVPVYRAAKFLFGHREAHPHWRALFTADCSDADTSYRKNRKRFPVTEKRINMLLALQPLVCFKSITNGALIFKYYFRRFSSETVSLWRPFARREARTLRPLAVCIRLRKPCTVLRRLRCG